MNAPLGSDVVRFAVFELDLQSRELRKAGVRLSLQEQPLQILECLLEHPGALVNRDELRKRLWPGDTFVDFEHGLNAAVKRLRDTLGDSADSPRFIETVPRRGYRFLAPVERPGGVTVPAESGSVTDAASRRRLRTWRWGAAVLVALAASALGWRTLEWRPVGAAYEPAMRVTPLSTLSGMSDDPTFSPDGEQVAFARQDTGSSTASIYVQMVGSTEVRRLTTGPKDHIPSWSPDGARIAFIREVGSARRLYVTSPIGGAERQLSDLAFWGPISWSPDGKQLALPHAVATGTTVEGSAIWLVPSDGGPARALTHPKLAEYHGAPAFSPDGRRLAYCSCNIGGCHVYVVELGRDLTPSASPSRLTPQTFRRISTIAWSRDGRWLVFDAMNAYVMRLLRVPADGSRPPVPIEEAGLGAWAPATARTRDRLAFSVFTENADVYRVGQGQRAEPVINSSFGDIQPEFSADGARIAFCSERTGDAVEVWVAARDGTAARQLTHGPNNFQCSPHWSPDGNVIVFDSRSPDGSWHIWSIDSAGGVPRQITKDGGSQNMPSWSHDGRWIYFTANRGVCCEAWRMRADGTDRQELLHSGTSGYTRESANGEDLLYQTAEHDSPLMAMPLTGGVARQLVACVGWTRFAVTLSRLYYVPCNPADPDPEVHVLDTATGHDRVFARVEQMRSAPGLAVAPDDSAVYYTRMSSQSANLMLIENFK